MSIIQTFYDNLAGFMRVNKLMELDAQVKDEDRIPARFPIEKMKKEYKNK